MDLDHERLNFRPKMPYSRPERPDLRPEGPDGGGMNKRMNGQTN